MVTDILQPYPLPKLLFPSLHYTRSAQDHSGFAPDYHILSDRVRLHSSASLMD